MNVVCENELTELVAGWRDVTSCALGPASLSQVGLGLTFSPRVI